MAQLLDEIRGENIGVCQISDFFGADPELDDFMVSFMRKPHIFFFFKFQTLSVFFSYPNQFLNDLLTTCFSFLIICLLVASKETYCNLLAKYKYDISRPFEEATAFLNDMETQLNSIICNGPAATNNTDPALGLLSLSLSLSL